MKPLYPDGREGGLPTLRRDGSAIGPAVRVLAVIVLAPLLWMLAAQGLAIHDAGALPLKDCPVRRGWLFCELHNLLAAWVPATLVGPIGAALRLGFVVLLLGVIAWLLKPVSMRHRS